MIQVSLFDQLEVMMNMIVSSPLNLLICCSIRVLVNFVQKEKARVIADSALQRNYK